MFLKMSANNLKGDRFFGVLLLFDEPTILKVVVFHYLVTLSNAFSLTV